MTSRATLISLGEPAPDFSALLSDGTRLTLSELRDKKRVVLVFYPGDNTPGCTAQLCALRDDWSRFQAHSTLVFGVNPAGEMRHARFAARHHFPFPLIVDAGGGIAAAYGCRGLFGLVRRTVYLVDGKGRIIYAQRGAPSPEEILREISGLEDELEEP